MQDTFNPYRDWLGIPDAKGRPNHYRLLGLRLFEDDAAIVQGAVTRWKNVLALHLNGPQRAAAESLIAEIESAGQQLLKPNQRTAYDQQLRQQLMSGAKPQIVAANGQNAPLPLPPGMSPPAAGNTTASSNTGGAADSAVFDDSLLPPGAGPAVPQISSPQTVLPQPSAVPLPPGMGAPAALPGYEPAAGYPAAAVPNYGAPAAPAYGMPGLPLPPGMQPSAGYPQQPNYGMPQSGYGAPQPAYGVPQPTYPSADWQTALPAAQPGLMPGYAPQAAPAGYAPAALPLPGYAATPLPPGFDPMTGAAAAPMALPTGYAPTAAATPAWSQPAAADGGFGIAPKIETAPSFLAEAALQNAAVPSAQANAPTLAPTISAPSNLSERTERSSLGAYIGAGVVAVVAVVGLLIAFKKERPAPALSTAQATNNPGTSATTSETSTTGQANQPGPANSTTNGNSSSSGNQGNPGTTMPNTQPQPMPSVTPLPENTSTPTTTPTTTTPTVTPPDSTPPTPSTTPNNPTTPTTPTTPTSTTPDPPATTPTTPTTPTPPTPTTPDPPVTTPPMPLPATQPSSSPAGVALLASRWSLSQRDLPTATAKLAEARQADSGKQLENEINRQEALVHYSDEFWRAVREAIKALVPGDQATIGGTIVGVVEVNPDRFILRVAGQNRTYQIDSLPPRLAYGLAEGWLTKGDPVSLIILGTFHACDANGTRDTARQLWQDASGLGRKEEVDVLLPELAVPLPERPDAPALVSPTNPGPSSSGLTTAEMTLKPNADGKFPPPGATVQGKARAEVQQMFQADFSEAKEPAQWAELAGTLTTRADESKDNPLLRYALLVEARELAGKAGQYDQVIATIDKLAEVFVIDALDTKADALSDAAKLATTPESQAALAQSALAVCDEAVLLEQSTPAMKLARVALAAARKNGDMELIKTCIAREKEVRDLK